MLTDSQIRSAKPAGRARKLSDGGGLYLLLKPNGGRYWRFNYRFQGKGKTLALGTYPDVPLAMARARHQDARRQLGEGIDPAAKKQIAVTTFEAVAREWYARWKPGRNQQYAFYVLKRLETDIFPAFGAQPISEVPASAFRQAVQKIEQRGAAEIAKRVLQNCAQIMRYAVANDMADRNPVADVRPADILKPRKKRNHPRVSAKELPTLLQAIDRYVGNEHTVLALQLMALTFVRTSELIGARWPEFDFKAARWEIPKERMKMKTPHIVAMSTQTIEVLEKLKAISFSRELVFPGDVDPSKPMSNNTLLFALYRMGYRSRMTGHGFRGVASTILHEQGWPHEHIELQLAHEERDETSAAYNYALYLKPRAEMMQAWADHLDQLRRHQSEAHKEHQS
jgi:integrase